MWPQSLVKTVKGVVFGVMVVGEIGVISVVVSSWLASLHYIV